jgi:ATP-binding cassette subfamily C (CFTR/MRP) protein 1
MSEQFTSVVVIAGAIFWSADRQALTVAQAFTTLSIIALVSFPLTTLLSQYPNIIAAASCFDRIRKYLTSKEKEDHRLLDLKSTSESHNNDSWMATMPFDQGIELEEIRCPQTDTKSKIFHRDILRVEEGTFGMRGDGTPILNNINIRFPKSSFTMIIGPIGSGKSTFIKSILGEIPSSKGFVRVASVSAAYCDQTSWLVNTTVRENILGESEFDPQWYSTVLHVCMLYEDLAQFPQGHDSLVGSGGISLSGGQKQRIVS